MAEPPHRAKYERILLKLSGEALMGQTGFGLDPEVMAETAGEIWAAARAGCQMGVVVGGGNIFRGLSQSAKNMDRVAADHMGMLATMINALALREAIRAVGGKAEAMSAVECGQMAPVFNRDQAVAWLDDGRVVIFGGGTGHPYFTTDTTSSLRAVEIKAEALFKATKVDGVYDSDPATNPQAERFDKLTYQEVIVRNLRVMDQTAVSMCRDNGLAMLVFKLAPGNLSRAVGRGDIGTVISN